MAHDRPPQPPSQGQSRVWVGTGVGQPHDWVMVEMCRQAGTMQLEHRTPVVVAVGQPVWMGGVTVTEAVGGVTVVSWTLLLPPSPRVFWAVARAAVLLCREGGEREYELVLLWGLYRACAIQEVEFLRRRSETINVGMN